MTSQEAFNLAKKYAPIFAQKVSNEWKAADQIAPADFAGSLLKIQENPDLLLDLDAAALVEAGGVASDQILSQFVPFHPIFYR